MNKRYFWIKDRVNTEEITIQYCPTYKMKADFLVNPLQRSLFRIVRDAILGYKHVLVLDVVEGIQYPRSVLERIRS